MEYMGVTAITSVIYKFLIIPFIYQKNYLKKTLKFFIFVIGNRYFLLSNIIQHKYSLILCNW
jgi:hypothetical protein